MNFGPSARFVDCRFAAGKGTVTLECDVSSAAAARSSRIVAAPLLATGWVQGPRIDVHADRYCKGRDEWLYATIKDVDLRGEAYVYVTEIHTRAMAATLPADTQDCLRRAGATLTLEELRKSATAPK